MLDTFQALFESKIYRHRSGNQGDQLATELYEDLYRLNRSVKYVRDVDAIRRGISLANRRQGISARRGDGTLGELIPNLPIVAEPGYAVRRGSVATLDVGVEVKILNKAQVKQINDRIAGLQTQAEYFVRGRDGRACGRPITVAIVGVNSAPYAVGYEGERQFRTDGRTHAHPFQEAPVVEVRLAAEVKPRYDELIILRYQATNEAPFPFAWVDAAATAGDYAAALIRISAEYERRF
jgi:hypothetical protein